jgi:hypothetical protein
MYRPLLSYCFCRAGLAAAAPSAAAVLEYVHVQLDLLQPPSFSGHLRPMQGGSGRWIVNV